MFRNLLPKEVFLTRLFSLYMTRNVYLGSIYSFFCSGELLVLVIRGSTNDNEYNARFFFFIFIYTISPSQLGFLGRGGGKAVLK